MRLKEKFASTYCINTYPARGRLADRCHKKSPAPPRELLTTPKTHLLYWETKPVERCWQQHHLQNHCWHGVSEVVKHEKTPLTFPNARAKWRAGNPKFERMLVERHDSGVGSFLPQLAWAINNRQRIQFQVTRILHTRWAIAWTAVWTAVWTWAVVARFWTAAWTAAWTTAWTWGRVNCGPVPANNNNHNTVQYTMRLESLLR